LTTEERELAMRIDQRLRSAIYRAARKKVGGANPLFECGVRQAYSGSGSVNAFQWGEDADLDTFIRLADLKEAPMEEGFCELDLYATTGIGDERQLETNVTVRFDSTGRVTHCWSVGEGRWEAGNASE
jgi:hypothetical protein